MSSPPSPGSNPSGPWPTLLWAPRNEMCPPNRWPGWLVAAVLASDKKETGGGGTTELCVSSVDPESRNLTPADWRRLYDFNQSDLYAYVFERCPQRLDKVLED